MIYQRQSPQIKHLFLFSENLIHFVAEKKINIMKFLEVKITQISEQVVYIFCIYTIQSAITLLSEVPLGGKL